MPGRAAYRAGPLALDRDQSVSRDLEKDRHRRSKPDGKAESTKPPEPSNPGGEDLLKPTF